MYIQYAWPIHNIAQCTHMHVHTCMYLATHLHLPSTPYPTHTRLSQSSNETAPYQIPPLSTPPCLSYTLHTHTHSPPLIAPSLSHTHARSTPLAHARLAESLLWVRGEELRLCFIFFLFCFCMPGLVLCFCHVSRSLT